MMGNGCMSRRSFVLGAAALGVVGTLGLSGCGAEPEETYAVGDTVESELVRLTLDDAQLAIALNNSFASFGPEGTTYNEDYFLPKPYDEAEDEDNPFVAAKGYTLVWFEVVLENLDRESVDLPLRLSPRVSPPSSRSPMTERTTQAMTSPTSRSPTNSASRSSTLTVPGSLGMVALQASFSARRGASCIAATSRFPSSPSRSTTRSPSPSRSPIPTTRSRASRSR